MVPAAERDRFQLTQDSYGRVARGYANYYWHKRVMAAELDKFIGLIAAGCTVLDAGCGPGQDSALLASRGFRVVGVDACEAMITEARARVPDATFYVKDFRVDDADVLRGFGGVWACASLLHVERAEMLPTLIQFRTWLVPDGVLYMSLMRGVGEEVRIEHRPFGLMERLFTYFGEAEVREYLWEAGFRKIDLGGKGRWLSCFASRLE